MDTRNSQKKSPRNSAKSEAKSSETRASASAHETSGNFDEENYMDHSLDHVARVRAAKEAAQREMESFGDVSEYDITILQGQLKEEASAPSQAPLAFESDAPDGSQETE